MLKSAIWIFWMDFFVSQIARRLGAVLLKVVLVGIIGYAAARLILSTIYYR